MATNLLKGYRADTFNSFLHRITIEKKTKKDFFLLSIRLAHFETWVPWLQEIFLENLPIQKVVGRKEKVTQSEVNFWSADSFAPIVEL